MAAVAVRKKVVIIGHFSPRFCLQSLQIFLFVRSEKDELDELKLGELGELDELDELRYSKSLQTTSYAH